MSVPFSYRRPASNRSNRSSGSSKASITSEKPQSFDDSISTGRTSIRGIPEQLSFDRIITGGTCPPCTKRDFFNYLKYVELGAENLLFYLWYLDYEKRFNALPETERNLSPEWTEEMGAKRMAAYQAKRRTANYPNAATAQVFKALDVESPTAGSEENLVSKEKLASSDDILSSAGSIRPESIAQTTGTTMTAKSMYSQRSENAFTDAGLMWQPFTVQPYREEMSRIITIYLADKSPRQLNLSARDVSLTLHALETTTHPSAFRNVMKTVEWTLRNQSHPNFIRWTICNGNRPRVFFARGLGVFLILAGIVMGVVMCLSNLHRAWRVFTLLPFVLGISTLIAAWKGMCVVLHGLHHRHLRPWELFDGDDVKSIADSDYEESTALPLSWEDEPWVAKYKKRNILRKIFDREIWIDEPMLRQIQDMIFYQSLLAAIILGGFATAVFLAVPRGNFF